eukprot:GHVP01009221.1.p1 GENE.GHVP01009221.1~~GHVP01009221.1.p1  ORF type:complete len:377 (+),score=62.70 GHVP01009221.1:447-1577(+)
MAHTSILLHVQNDSSSMKYTQKEDGSFKPIKEILCKTVNTATEIFKKRIHGTGISLENREDITCYIEDMELVEVLKLNKLCIVEGDLEGNTMTVSKCKEFEMTPTIEGSDISLTRDEICSRIDSMLGSSGIGEILLITILSVTGSKIDETNLGRIVLNIKGISIESDLFTRLSHVLQSILPSFKQVDFNCEETDKTKYYSKICSETEKITQGGLSVCDGTCVLIDERKLNEGRISDVPNLQTLQNFLEDDVFGIECGNQIFFFPTKASKIIISDQKTVLPHTHSITIDSKIPRKEWIPSDKCLDYILRCFSYEFTLQKSMADELQELFKTEKSEQYTGEMFSDDLNIFRLLCISNISEGTIDLWKKAQIIGSKLRK